MTVRRRRMTRRHRRQRHSHSTMWCRRGTTPDLTIVSVNANGNPIQDALGNNVNFAAATGSATGVAVVACFAAGTRIATVRGEVAVEALRVGDLVCVVGPHSSPSL